MAHVTGGTVLDLGLKGKVALITGASKGLGRAIGEDFSPKKACTSPSVPEEMTTWKKPQPGYAEHGVTVVATQADVTQADGVQHVIDETIKRLGRIDVLVNNAGDAWAAHMVDTTDDEWRYCMEVNLYSAARHYPRRGAAYAPARGRAHHQHVHGQRAHSGRCVD